jgi:DNA-3-methyladenine glycosylase
MLIVFWLFKRLEINHSFETKNYFFMKLKADFYQRPDVVRVAKELLGKVLITHIEKQLSVARIVETEAYSWKERGCHAFGGKKTTRNAVMFNPGGVAYVYLCYGIHHLFNVVTNERNVAEAVLIRAVEPVKGVEWMASRRNLGAQSRQLTSGPGKLTKALGIDRSFNGLDLTKNQIWIESDGTTVNRNKTGVAKRVGIDYADDDAELPWRFFIKDNPWVSVS